MSYQNKIFTAIILFGFSTTALASLPYDDYKDTLPPQGQHYLIQTNELPSPPDGNGHLVLSFELGASGSDWNDAFQTAKFRDQQNYRSIDSATNPWGAAVRLGLGYDFNNYVGLRADYTYFTDVHWTGTGNLTAAAGGTAQDRNIKVEQYQLDLLAVLYLPISPVQLSVSGGYADLDTTLQDQIGAPTNNTFIRDENTWLPVVGAGIRYYFKTNPEWGVSLHYIHLFGQDNVRFQANSNSANFFNIDQPSKNTILFGVFVRV